MKRSIYILRCERGSRSSYWERFIYELRSENDTLATALQIINKKISSQEAEGDPERQIEWECSCLQKKCGACAMVINNRPMLACDARITDIKSEEIRVEPLRKFPVVCDLIVDRSVLFENLKTMKAWLREDAILGDQYRELAYESSECLQCGCCLEVCPNFYPGGLFFGMAAIPVTTRLLTAADRKSFNDISRAYIKHAFEGCGKSLSCKDICPKKIDTEKLLVNANAMAIWKRRGGKHDSKQR